MNRCVRYLMLSILSYNKNEANSILYLLPRFFNSYFLCLRNYVRFCKLFFLFLLVAFVSKGQNISVSYNSTGLPDGAFTVCGTSKTNSLRINNGNGFALTNTRFTLKIPTGGTYVPGSITTSTIGMSVSEFNIANLNQPEFNLSNLGANNNVDITYQIQFGCGVIAFQSSGGLTKEILDFTYTNGSQNNVTATSVYDIIAASLSIINISNTSYTGNVGSSYSQTLTIRNGGLGCTNSAFIKLGGAGSFTFSNPSLGTLSNDTLFINNADMPGGDGLWCNSEDVVITYTITINNCNSLNRSTYVSWGCSGVFCQQSTSVNSNVIISNNTPNLVTTIISPNRNYCFTGENQKQTFRIINNGAGAATNILASFRTTYPGSFSGLAKFDTTVAWQVRDKVGNVLGSITNFINRSPVSISGSTCNSITRFNQLTGSLPANIILLPSDTIYFDVYQTAPNAACNICSTDMPWIGIQTQIDYKNQCGLGSYQEVWKGQLSVSRVMGTHTMIAPTNVADGQSFNVIASFNYFATFNNPNGSGKTASS